VEDENGTVLGVLGSIGGVEARERECVCGVYDIGLRMYSHDGLVLYCMNSEYSGPGVI
jgi:hypothetical protein